MVRKSGKACKTHLVYGPFCQTLTFSVSYNVCCLRDTESPRGQGAALILFALFIIPYAFQQLIKKDLLSGVADPSGRRSHLRVTNSQMPTVWQSWSCRLCNQIEQEQNGLQDWVTSLLSEPQFSHLHNGDHTGTITALTRIPSRKPGT